MSLDPVFIAEFAEAGWLTEIPADVADEVTDGIIPATVEDDHFQTPFGDVRLPQDRITSLGEQDVVLLGARPEHFEDTSVMSGRDRDDGLQFDVELDVIEWLGNEQFAYVPYDAPDDDVDKVRVFDPESGANLSLQN